MKTISINSTLSDSHLRNAITGQYNPIQPLSLLLLYSLRSFHSFLSLLFKPNSLTTTLKLYEEPYSHAYQRRHSRIDQ